MFRDFWKVATWRLPFFNVRVGILHLIMEWKTYARHLAMQIWFDLDVCYYSKDAISCHMVLREIHALLVYLCIDVNKSTNSL